MTCVGDRDPNPCGLTSGCLSLGFCNSKQEFPPDGRMESTALDNTQAMTWRRLVAQQLSAATGLYCLRTTISESRSLPSKFASTESMRAGMRQELVTIVGGGSASSALPPGLRAKVPFVPIEDIGFRWAVIFHPAGREGLRRRSVGYSLHAR